MFADILNDLDENPIYRRAMWRSFKAHAISITHSDDEWWAVPPKMEKNMLKKNPYQKLWISIQEEVTTILQYSQHLEHFLNTK